MAETTSEKTVHYRRAGIHIAALIGVVAMLLFHPGAMDMDRLKSNFLLCIILPLLLGAFGFSRLFSVVSAPLKGSLAAAAMIPVLLALSRVVNSMPGTEGIALITGFLLLITLALAVSAPARERPLAVPFWLLAAGGITALYGLFQSAGLDPFYLENPGKEAVSTLGNSNELAEVTALLIPLALSLIFVPDKKALALGACTLPLLIGALWVSGGRGGVLAALFGMTAFCAVYLGFARKHKETEIPAKAEFAAPARRWIRPALFAVCLGLGLLLGVLFGSGRSLALKNIESEASIFSPEYPTNKVRIEIWKSTLAMIRDHPLTGVGAGRFRVAFPPYRSPEEARIPGLMGAVTEVDDPHNEYLWAAAVGGIPLAVVLMVFLLLLIRASAAGAKNAPSLGERTLAGGRMGTALAFAILCIFRSPLHNPAAAVILFLVAGLSAPGLIEAGKGMRCTIERRGAPLVLGGLLITCLLIGVPGFASDWLAASVGIADDLGLEEFETLKRAADLDPSNIEIINYIGQIAGGTLMGTEVDRDGRYRIEAEKRLTHVLERHPYHPGALITLARIRALQKEYSHALWLIERYLAVRMETDRPEMVLFKILDNDARYKEAADLILDTRPLEPEPLYDRATLLFEQGSTKAALIYIDHYLQARPLDGDALFLLGKCMKALYDTGEKDVYRRMHIAYALEWIEKGDWAQGSRSIRASRRYGEGEGEAMVLSAVVDAAGGAGFTPPPIGTLKNKAFMDRMKALAESGKLPEEAAAWIRKIYRDR